MNDIAKILEDKREHERISIKEWDAKHRAEDKTEKEFTLAVYFCDFTWVCVLFKVWYARFCKQYILGLYKGFLEQIYVN